MVDDPLEQLERSHRRLEEACDALAAAATGRDLETLADVTSFLGRQVRRHEQDEEASLFPRLAGSGVDAILERLSRAHREHEALQTRLEAAWQHRDDRSGDPAWEDLTAVAEAIAAAYRRHIEEEERELFPHARKALTAAALAEIRQEMNARRGR
jgi:hemerythrin-like domain-containing protein